MQIGFKRFDKDWILPIDGTLGNKAQNLFANREAIAAAGFRRPEAVVVPWEYLRQVFKPEQFVLSITDEWLPGWSRVYVRSNAPDEDADRRIPGLYSTEHIWHKDRAYVGTLVERVIGSYRTVVARRSRKMRGVPESGMGILLERAVSDTEADYAGSYTECGGSSELLFAWPDQLHKAMTFPPKKSYRVINGRIEADHTSEEGKIAARLTDLAARLPRIEGKGWEIEFVVHKGEIYAAQVTPSIKHHPIVVPQGVQSFFEVGQVVGTGNYSLDGILHMPPFPNERGIRALEKFDSKQANYAVLTKEVAISSVNRDSSQLFMWLLNAHAFLITNMQGAAHPLVAHTRQYLRNTGVALEVKGSWDVPFGPFYSPTKLRVIADEASEKAVVLLEEPLRPFERLEV